MTQGSAKLNTYQSMPFSYIRRKNGTTRGSTNTYVVIYGTAVESNGTDITYVNSAASGDSFTINTSGIYTISISIYVNASGQVPNLGLQIGDSISNTFNANMVSSSSATATGATVHLSWTGYIAANKKVYAHSYTALYNDAENNIISIARVA